MDWKRTKKLMVRWSLISAAFFALFWGAWYLIAGEVPELTEIKWNNKIIYQLPFAISRWWDVLLVPLWVNLIIITIGVIKKISKTIQKNDFLAILLCPLSIGLLFGLPVWGICIRGSNSTLGMVWGMIIFLGLGLLFSLPAGLCDKSTNGLIGSLTVGLAASIVINITLGLSIGLIFCITFDLITVLLWLIIVLIKNNFSKIKTYLLAQDNGC